MSGKKIFQIDPENWPNQTTRERVVSERGRKELPPGTKGGENLKPDRHYEHKQYAFDSYCKKVLKCEACNGYRQISRHQKRFTSLEELSEAEMAQLAVYDRYPWEYTTFPVGGAVILIEDDGLAEALLGLSQEDLEIFMMHWFLRMTKSACTRASLIPYPVIAAAVGGDPEAVNRVVRHYSGYIAALSTRTSYGPDGYPRPQVDEDLRGRLEAKLIISILDFDLS